MVLKQDSEFSRHLRKEATKALDTVLAFGVTLEDTLEKSKKELGTMIFSRVKEVKIDDVLSDAVGGAVDKLKSYKDALKGSRQVDKK